MTTATQGSMGDREMVSDLLASQKLTASTYNNYAGECKCDNMRNSFLDILREEHQIQNDLFVTMESRGWYPTKEAPVTEVSAAKQKFSS